MIEERMTDNRWIGNTGDDGYIRFVRLIGDR